MGRSYQQVIVGKENDSFFRTLENTDGTASITVGTVNKPETIFVTDIGVSGGVSVSLAIKNGTAFMYQQTIPANTPFSHTFHVPLKCSVGTKCVSDISGADGTVKLNIGGYRRGQTS